MAIVYLARDVRHDRRVALKLLRPDLGAVVGAERFLAEIRTTATLQHPNLLPLFDSGVADGVPYYVMPFVEGETLRARLDRERQLPVDEAVRLATAIAGALDYAHRQGIIHRDLKPENILLQEGQPLVADFGIALAVSKAGGARVTQTGLSLGTPQYMSPEQATGDRAIDARTDVYSLGALTYEMLTGEPPHTGSTAQAIIARLVTEVPRRVRASRPAVAVSIDAAVAQALEKLPADRLTTAREFAEALSGRLSATLPDAERPAPATTRARRVRDGVLAAAALVGLGSAAWMATRRESAPVVANLTVVMPDSVFFTNSIYTSFPTVALSHDGQRLAFLGRAEGAGEIHIWVRDLAQAEPRRIDGTSGADLPVFSPDGSQLLFRSRTGLQRVSIAGGTPELVVSRADPSPPDWTDRGEILFVREDTLWAVDVSGGQPRLVAAPDSGRVHNPASLPGGRHALITVSAGSIARSARQLAVVDLETGHLDTLGVRGSQGRYAAPGFLVYEGTNEDITAVPFSLRKRQITGVASRVVSGVRSGPLSGSDFAVARDGGALAWRRGGGRGGQSQMLIVDRAGGHARELGPSDLFTEPRVSPDGRHVLVRTGRGATSGDLWLYEVSSGGRTRLTSDGRSWRGEWSADGKEITFLRGPDIGADLVAMPSDRSGPARVLLTAEKTGPRSMLQTIAPGPKGGWSVIRIGSRAAGQNPDLLIAPTDSLAALRPLLASPFNELEPRISPDGKLLAYTSDESGLPEVYLTPLPGPGPRIPVSVGGGLEPTWSRDGRTLYYRGPSDFMAARIETGAVPTVTRRDLLFADMYRRYNGFAAYDVFPDGEHFVVVRRESTTSRASQGVQVWLGWQSVMRAGGGTNR